MPDSEPAPLRANHKRAATIGEEQLSEISKKIAASFGAKRAKILDEIAFRKAHLPIELRKQIMYLYPSAPGKGRGYRPFLPYLNALRALTPNVQWPPQFP